MSATHMDAIEIADFLEGHHTGVLALANDDTGYAIPVSYAYDDAGPAIYFRLGYAEESQKREYVETTRSASFVVYGETTEGWKSVVAQGPIEDCSESEMETNQITAVRDLEIPFFAVHPRPTGELAFTIVRIAIADLTGIVEG